jgi:hypothetical protein
MSGIPHDELTPGQLVVVSYVAEVLAASRRRWDGRWAAEVVEGDRVYPIPPSATVTAVPPLNPAAHLPPPPSEVHLPDRLSLVQRVQVPCGCIRAVDKISGLAVIERSCPEGQR